MRILQNAGCDQFRGIEWWREPILGDDQLSLRRDNFNR